MGNRGSVLPRASGGRCRAQRTPLRGEEAGLFIHQLRPPAHADVPAVRGTAEAEALGLCTGHQRPRVKGGHAQGPGCNANCHGPEGKGALPLLFQSLPFFFPMKRILVFDFVSPNEHCQLQQDVRS